MLAAEGGWPAVSDDGANNTLMPDDTQPFHGLVTLNPCGLTSGRQVRPSVSGTR